MKAAVCFEKDKLTIDDIHFDAPRAQEVLVRMVACGVCHTDLSVLNGTVKMKLPCVLGHEGAGLVEEVGEGVTHVKKGDKVVLSWVAQCGECYYCRIQRPNLCVLGEKINAGNRMPDGSTRLHKDDTDLNVFSALGALSEYAVVPARAAVKLPSDAPLDKAALIGCAVTTGVGAVLNTAEMPRGATVAVFGAGGVGLNIIQGAVIAGAERIIAVDVHPKKLELAKVFGATDVVDAKAGDPVAAIRELTQGRGADYAYEAVGRKETIEQAYMCTRKAGTCVVVGVGSVKESISLNVFVLPLFEKRLLGSWFGTADVHRDMPRLLDLYTQGKLKLDELVTTTYKLDQLDAAFTDMKNGVNARGVVLF
ncbi:Zn-dependent alcohol dehydrogenase [Pyxidicoccus parkwayensis]|uniref:Zn-dependent alcohol dehydrogenase n=1 Tax=Pyxidicoccus parkwayensis TaxID=2813578 RepID=A0ABX7P1A4_9BACT|nr:Zn-dependent alcohol dehydrogenase [Pyxidicoccus parkwaysis]QSQ24534.1 Zn-dependent alcohol dehydrogenase [Pyxidicoccus parkwaysis]